MADTGGGSQLPPDKPHIAKPAPLYISSALQKAPLKVFRPRLNARRRDPATAAPPPPSVEPQPTEAQSSPALVQEPQTTPQTTPQAPLPTPAATQDAAPQGTSQTAPNAAQPPNSDPEPATATTAPAVTPDPTPAPGVEQSVQPNEVVQDAPRPPRSVRSPQPAEDNIESSRSPKRRRIEHLPTAHDHVASLAIDEPASVVADQAAAPTVSQSVPEAEYLSQPPSAQPPEDPAVPASSAVPNSATEDNARTRVGEGAANEAATVGQPSAQGPRSRRRKLPWVAVNQPRDVDEAADAAATTRSTKARGKRKTATAPETEEQEEEGAEEGAEVVTRPTTRPKPRAPKGAGRRRAAGDADADADADPAAAALAEDTTATPLAKKPRKPRKDKGTRRNRPDEMEELEGLGTLEGEDGAVDGARKRQRKKRRPASAGENQEGDQSTRPRGRQRETTPSDAEDHEINTTATFMDRIASRNIRVGKMSERERKMREINWEEVKERRREEEAVGVTRMEDREELENRLAAAGADRNERYPEQQESSVQQMEFVNGAIRIVESSRNIDREAQADREYEMMETIEEDDLTNRITVRSFLRNNKRFPKEFILPGRGKRWSAEATEEFYSALQMFGTDFGMIATMFPGTTRTSIKGKFNREERDHPGRIKEVLNGQRNLNWDEYLRRSNTKNESYADPDAIKQDLESERTRMEVEIEAARMAHAEEVRQRKLANPGGDNAEKENGKKGGKKGEKTKTVAFADEAGVVEVDGNMEDWLNEN